jgi:hypothetical protein
MAASQERRYGTGWRQKFPAPALGMRMERFQMWILSSAWGKSPQNFHPFQETDMPSSPQTNLDIRPLSCSLTHLSVNCLETYNAHQVGSAALRS